MTKQPNRNTFHLRSRRLMFALSALWTLGFPLTMCAVADTVRLKDGTVCDGDILSETDQQIVVRFTYGSSKISGTRTIKKTDVLEIIRLTAEQKRTQQMQQEFDELKEYQLRPDTSYTIEYY